MRQEGRGIGLLEKIKAYGLQDKGYDTVQANLKLGFEADMRNYATAVQILKNLGIKKINLLTNNPRKIKGLAKAGILINKRIPIEISPNKYNLRYLKTKKNVLGQFLNKV